MHFFNKYILFSKNDRIVIIAVFLALSILCGIRIHKVRESYKKEFVSYNIIQFKRKLAAIINGDIVEKSTEISKTFQTSALIVDINTATKKELLKLPNIGPVYAQRILEYRNNVGKFKNVEELIKIKGIGKKRLKKLRPYLKISN